VTDIEESKDLDEIKVQELIGSFQTYELSLPSQRKSKSLLLRRSMRELKLKIPWMMMRLKERWHTLQRAFASS